MARPVAERGGARAARCGDEDEHGPRTRRRLCVFGVPLRFSIRLGAGRERKGSEDIRTTGRPEGGRRRPREPHRASPPRPLALFFEEKNADPEPSLEGRDRRFVFFFLSLKLRADLVVASSSRRETLFVRSRLRRPSAHVPAKTLRGRSPPKHTLFERPRDRLNSRQLVSSGEIYGSRDTTLLATRRARFARAKLKLVPPPLDKTRRRRRVSLSKNPKGEIRPRAASVAPQPCTREGDNEMSRKSASVSYRKETTNRRFSLSLSPSVPLLAPRTYMNPHLLSLV